ncbi:ABC transporter ATP-binding protein [Nocardioides sp. AE5]|uniref:ABC transporter ATP-binding protein n=1 Tax=Nocardioides sp. AE5 TaxID=2962573 RepID=UPI002881D6C4|nr:ABC transporter ATP-binding protein [Nocardioides sp. AE5]MDT0200317.1 ABC transporter ATP-binding protein [Nocardioides sp. AE5]
MSSVEIRGACFGYGSSEVLTDLDLDVASGELVSLIGPSGCGKTTLLRLLAGFERPRAGTIALGGRIVADRATFTAPHRRRVAIVPQEGALFPHLDVAANIGYGLPRRSPDRAARVEELLDLVDLDGLGNRYPRQLSGGQQQRVALARALAPRPDVVLLDEPFAALDADTRRVVRRAVVEVLLAERATGVLVTHDRDEALSLATRTAVMIDGRVVQAGAPDEVYACPVDARVARLLGEATLVPVARAGDGIVECALGRLEVADDAPLGGGSGLQVLVRPEQLRLADDGVPARVVTSDFHGATSRVGVELADGTRLVMETPGAVQPRVGEAVTVSTTGAVHVLAG